jgi:hypothetical protein
MVRQALGAVATAANWRNILVACASDADDTALELAVALATTSRARLTIAVPVVRPSVFAALVPVNVEGLGVELEASATQEASRVAGAVPHEIPIVIRCVPRRNERVLGREVRSGAWDLLIRCGGRCDPGTLWGRLGGRLERDARRCGVQTIVVSRRPRARPAAAAPSTVDPGGQGPVSGARVVAGLVADAHVGLEHVRVEQPRTVSAVCDRASPQHVRGVGEL